MKTEKLYNGIADFKMKTYLKYGESFAGTVCRLFAIFGRQRAQNYFTVKGTIKKFYQTGSVVNENASGCSRSDRFIENIVLAMVLVNASIRDNPGISIFHRYIDCKESASL